MGGAIVLDPRVDFFAYHVRYKLKTQQRQYISALAIAWIRFQKKRGCSGAVMVDIDDTLINGNEAVVHGFQYMKELYLAASLLFPLHVVTARPLDEHANVMKMLADRGFSIPPDRLHMLPTHLYDDDRVSSHVEKFKWQTALKIGKAHGGIVARFGDKLWDVAHYESLQTYLKHVRDADCYVFMDPALQGTASFKLPGS